jgi:alkylated DNA repair dioxygenase AlkB
VNELDQPGLFDDDAAEAAATSLPEGMRYWADLLSATEEQDLVRGIATLPFEDFEFHGFTGKRRVVSFGWRYDFDESKLQKADDIPLFLLPLRRRAAEFARLAPESFQHALVIEYRPGAAIGWHRDKPMFAEVVGVSLLSPCRFRMRRKMDNHWERAAIDLQPRSAYLLAGPARTQWEHSIPPMDRLRYSITFRNFVERS